MEWEFSNPIKNPQTIVIDDNKTSTWNNSKLSKIYNLKESVQLYQNLPKSTYLSLDSKEKIEVIEIKLSEIKQLEFVENPSNNWIEEIKKKTEQANQINNGPDSSGDFMPAFWYHEIVSIETNYDYYRPRIKRSTNN